MKMKVASRAGKFLRQTLIRPVDSGAKMVINQVQSLVKPKKVPEVLKNSEYSPTTIFLYFFVNESVYLNTIRAITVTGLIKS